MIELASIIILGILAQWLAWKFKVPAILPLILIGLLVGPISTFWMEGGVKWLEPIWDGSRGLFPGESLFYFVELAIGIILFEGGLTLKREEIRDVGQSVFNLISLGALVTFIGGALITHFLMGLSWPISFLFAGLIIVTGPTVISPILRNIPLKQNVSAVLKWEGILIDPVGALVAVLVFKFIMSLTDSQGGLYFTQDALLQFFRILLIGSSLGYFAAFTLKQFLTRSWIPHYLLNVFTLAFVLFVFVGSGVVVHDSGLLTIVIMGLILGNMDVPHLDEILYFKESLSVLLISVLFILLAANIDMADLRLLQDWRALALFAGVIFILRPVGVFLSTYRSNLTLNEKMFISWVGPRGIVAAGIASLFGTKLSTMGVAGAQYITPLVFLIVLGTVLLNATSARLIARLLGVMLEVSNGIIIFGASVAPRLIAKYLTDIGERVVIVDSNRTNIEKAKLEGINGLLGNIYQDDLADNIELNDIGYMMAMTASSDVNQFAINKFQEELGENGAYRLVTPSEMKENEIYPKQGLFSKHDDYINLSEVARDFPEFHEVLIDKQTDFERTLDRINVLEKSVPLFIKNTEGHITIITADKSNLKVNEGDRLIYMGKKISS